MKKCCEVPECYGLARLVVIVSGVVRKEVQHFVGGCAADRVVKEKFFSRRHARVRSLASYVFLLSHLSHHRPTNPKSTAQRGETRDNIPLICGHKEDDLLSHGENSCFITALC